jgi:hypothetical protein
MDQLKEQLIKIKPYAFWIACGVILIGSLATWYMATGTLYAQQAEFKQKIDGAFSGLNGVEPKLANHPNAATHEQMTRLTQAYGEEIARGWQLQYQRQEGVLVWPASFDQEFHDAVKNLRPIEKVPEKADVTLTIPANLRVRYRDFITDELPTLAETIGGRWQASHDPSTENINPPQAIGPEGRPVVEVDRSMVIWDPANQQEILVGHFGFTAREDAPTTLEVLYAQEDLWVIQNLMGIIKRTNEGAEGRHDAAVKQIEFIRLGKTALGTAGQVMVVGPGTNAVLGPGGPGGQGEGLMAPPQPGPPSPTGAPVGPAQPPVNPTSDQNYRGTDPGNWRYVDKNNVPLAGYQLRAAIAPPVPGAMPATPNPETALLTVAKRMPVRLRLEIDQRKLNKLLTEFGNAPLPVEVRQLRINREPAPLGSPEAFFSGIGGPGGGGPGGGVPAPGGGVREGMGGNFPGPGPRYGEGMPGTGVGQPQSATRDATLDTNLIKLEVYGIVYLYNPVNRGVLGLPPVAGAATAMNVPAVPAPSGG